METPKKSKIDEYIKEYEPLKELYENFSFVIKFILENLLCKNGFKYQAVTFREKSERSLRNKLNTIKRIKSVKDIDDLAGCRIIFYLDEDIERIVWYLQNEFIVVKENLKYSKKGYNARHFIVKLSEDRLKLSECEMFNGLKCEIQITTVLYHAWSELGHDIIYKPEKSLSEFDSPSSESIKARFAETMEVLKFAQREFDFIARQWEEIKQGKQIFSEEFLHDLEQAKTSYEIWQRLKLLREQVNNFGDKTPKELNIIEIINNKLEETKGLKKKHIKTAFGALPGIGYKDIAEVCLDILKLLRNVHPKDVFETLFRLSIDENEKIRKKSLDVVSKMARYTFYPEEGKIYYSLQLFILDEVEKWDNKKLLPNLSFMVKVSEKLLSPSFEGMSRSDHESVTILQGSLPAIDTVKKIRERTINILKKLYSLAETISDRRQILQAFEAVLKPKPYQVSTPEPELEKIILENINTVLAYYSTLIKEADNEIISAIEEQLHRLQLTQRFQKRLKNLNKLRSLIEKNECYGMYKLFFGLNYLAPDNLDLDVPDAELKRLDEVEKKRKQKIDEYVKQITGRNFLQRQKKILSIIKNYDHQAARKFEYFNIFLNELGKQKPEIARRLILENEKKLEPFLIHLIAGIWQSKQKENAEQILEDWIKKDKHLSTCAHIFKYVEEIDEPLLNKVYEKAKKQNDVNALINLTGSIVSNFEQSKVGKDLFVDCLKELTKHKNYCWIKYSKPILKILNEHDWDVVLKNLLYVPNIDINWKTPYAPNIGIHLNNILSACAKNFPKKLIVFFHERVKTHSTIPFELPKLLKEPLNRHAKVVIEEIFKCFNEEDWSPNLRGARLLLLRAIFPDFHPELEEQLIKLLKSKNRNKAEIVLCVLRSYQGETFLHNVCKEFIKKYPKNENYKQELFNVLLGVVNAVSGEYGFVELYEKKKQEIQGWKNDKSGVIRDFAREYENYLSKRINEEKKRADENIEMRKRKFES